MDKFSYHTKRIMGFINERFPPLTHGIFGFVTFYSFYFSWQVISIGSINVEPLSLVGAYTLSSMLFLLRVLDEIKDEETDKRLFPQRPLPSGRITRGELLAVATFIIVTNICINAVSWNTGTAIFMAMICFVLLATKWFFVPELLSKNIVLAFITHQPYVPMSYMYVAFHASRDIGVYDFSVYNVLLILVYWSGMMLWELSRKIRAPGYETDYQTYSMVLGWKKTTLICLAMALVMVMALIGVFFKINASPLLVIVVLSGLIICCIRFTLFLKRPTEKGSMFEKYVDFLHISMQGGLLFGLPLTF